jgi:hypothetical protein
MPTEITKGRGPDPVQQFSVFTANRLGRLNELVGMFSSKNVHVLAMTVLDTTDSAIIRLVVDDPDLARQLLSERSFPFTESPVLVVEVDSATDLSRVMSALLEAEVNINYLYAFIPHHRGKSLLALSVEDMEVAERVLKNRELRILDQSDISR